MLLWLSLLGCTPQPEPPGMTLDEVSARVRPGTEDPEKWAAAVVRGLDAADRPLDPDHVCQVLAVIEQESGYQADPEVPGISRMIRQELEDRLRLLGPLDDATIEALWRLKAEGSAQTLGERLEAARTEQDLDRLYRDLVQGAADRVPVLGPAATGLAAGAFDRANPVSTVGSMQVKVEYAMERRAALDLRRTEVRDALYTVEGGVVFGTLRLFETAEYTEPIHRFADFNAGPYASRNAAFQRQLQTLSGQTVQSDGDLLVYNDRGKPRAKQEGQTVTVLTAWGAAHGLDAERVVNDLRHEKSQALEQTATWTTVRSAFAEHMGRAPAEAILPVVVLDSPKLSSTWTTATFAERVQRRYTDCLGRG